MNDGGAIISLPPQGGRDRRRRRVRGREAAARPTRTQAPQGAARRRRRLLPRPCSGTVAPSLRPAFIQCPRRVASDAATVATDASMLQTPTSSVIKWSAYVTYSTA